MKCPKCSYVSFDFLDECKKCGRDLRTDKEKLGIPPSRPEETAHFSGRGLPAADSVEAVAEIRKARKGASVDSGELPTGQAFTSAPDEAGEADEPAAHPGSIGDEGEDETCISASHGAFRKASQLSLALGGEERESDVAERGISPLEGRETGNFIRRAFAFAVDHLVLSVIFYLFLMAGLYALEKGLSAAGERLTMGHILGLAGPLILLAFLLSAGYFTFFHWATGQTPGKMLFRLQVVRTDGGAVTAARAFLRWFGYALSTLPLMSGFLIALFDRRHQALHDKIAGTCVINAGKLFTEDKSAD